jgi:hypothetical protein
LGTRQVLRHLHKAERVRKQLEDLVAASLIYRKTLLLATVSLPGSKNYKDQQRGSTPECGKK